MPYNSRADGCQLMAEWYDTNSNVKLGRFQSQLEVSCMSSHADELGYKGTVCLWMTIYIYIYDKISGKVDKSNTYDGFNSNISFFI